MQLKWLEVTNTPHYRAWRHCKPAHPSTVTCIELKTLRVTSLVVSTRCVVPGTTIQDAVYRMYIVVRCNSLLWKEEYVGIALQSRIMIHFIEAFLILWLYSCWRGLCSCLRRRSVHLLRTTPALGNVEDKCTESRGLVITVFIFLHFIWTCHQVVLLNILLEDIWRLRWEAWTVWSETEILAYYRKLTYKFCFTKCQNC